jgi:signal transduction histidine kinase
MQKEVAVVEELQSVVKMLRENLAEERQKCTNLEI